MAKCIEVKKNYLAIRAERYNYFIIYILIAYEILITIKIYLLVKFFNFNA